MIKTSLHVPHTDNDGQAFLAEDWRELEIRLIDQFGGFSCDLHVAGAWRSATGVLYWDVSRRYIIALDSWARIPTFLDTVTWVIERFRQEAIYVDIAGIPEIIGRKIDIY